MNTNNKNKKVKVMKKNVYVYVDGFNVYHSIKKFWKKYYRLDYRKLAENYIDKENEAIQEVYYFTAYFNPKDDSDGVVRHKNYINALGVRRIKTILGKYQEVERRYTSKKKVRCFSIDKILVNSWLKQWFTLTKKIFLSALKYLFYTSWEEKRTDVNMAIQILADGMQRNYDKAIIITADSDISPAIAWLKNKKHWYRDLEFLSILPISHTGKTIAKICDDYKVITETELKQSQLNDRVKKFIRPLERKP